MTNELRRKAFNINIIVVRVLFLGPSYSCGREQDHHPAEARGLEGRAAPLPGHGSQEIFQAGQIIRLLLPIRLTMNSCLG